MNRILVAALAASLAATAAFAGPELKVTAYEAGLDGTAAAPAAPAGETKDAPAKAADAAKAAAKYVVVATVSIEDHPVWQGLYQGAGPFDDKAACTAALDDPKVKSDNDGLAAMAKSKIHPDAKVGVSCEELPADE